MIQFFKFGGKMAFGIGKISKAIESFTYFIEYQLGIDQSFINHIDEALTSIASLCNGADQKFLDDLKNIICYGAEGMEQFFSDPEFYNNLNRALNSFSNAADTIDPELISFVKSGIENFANVSQFFTPELQHSMIEALDTIAKAGSAFDNINSIINAIENFTSENSLLVYGIGGPIAALIIIAYVRNTLNNQSGISKELELKLSKLETEIQSIHLTMILNLRMTATTAAAIHIPKNRKISARDRKIIENGRLDAVKILDTTATFSDDFIRFLNYSQHNLKTAKDNSLKNLPDIEKIKLAGSKTNAGVFIDMMYSGALNSFEVKVDHINFNTVTNKLKNREEKLQVLNSKVKSQLNTSLHELYWAILRVESEPKDTLSGVMKHCYYQRNDNSRTQQFPAALHTKELKDAYLKFNSAFKQHYKDFIKNDQWHGDRILNNIYGETLFLHAFLDLNLDISNKLANYSISYAARQIYLGFEDVSRPFFEPIKTTKNLISFAKSMVQKPIETSTNAGKQFIQAAWNQPTRFMTKLASELLLAKAAKVAVDYSPDIHNIVENDTNLLRRGTYKAQPLKMHSNHALPTGNFSFGKALGAAKASDALNGYKKPLSITPLYSNTTSSKSHATISTPLSSTTMRKALEISNSFIKQKTKIKPA